MAIKEGRAISMLDCTGVGGQYLKLLTSVAVSDGSGAVPPGASLLSRAVTCILSTFYVVKWL